MITFAKLARGLVIIGLLLLSAMQQAGATCSSRPLLQRWSGYGDTGIGVSVKVVQEKLNEIQGIDLDVDGLFGRLTKTAVRNFQRSEGLSVDGIVGPNTWEALCSFPTSNSNNTPTTNKICPKKKIKITKFCIDGTRADVGDEAEIKFYLGGRRYYPKFRSHCTQTSYGYCDVTENGCLHLRNAQWMKDAVENYQALTVSVREHDYLDNDDYYAVIKDWHDDTCEPYELRVATDYISKQQKKTCVGISAGGPIKAIDIGASFESCSTWEDPPQSFVWYIAVEPMDE
mmetsp:Transcript_3519/g.9997  ORF Transcript_3519/g.9997 Transcript_3519/m.9997 type:complete len:286 (+) Transcript_3519:291-1148(+)|eukprot:CAMPEP_0181046912 /NCGR_PEP_ID=MMETSP1070-20121207/14594_1 /TAXON_ID=265543 /ORGANISM="Minutocellus polymorphus, Strain NH13" /LENGTH=285 /DNA_ID=CAMNT_0023125539 /DNA_START=350 /DNA_END=1207 /DNA_ORIENTATION=+